MNNKFKPKTFHNFYWIDKDNEIVRDIWTDGEHDFELLREGNCFETAEEAEEEKNKKK